MSREEANGLFNRSMCEDTESADGIANARLIAAAPTMHDYIANRAAASDAEAIAILENINGNR